MVEVGVPDIESDISFICTGVTNSTAEDKSKLKHVLKLLKKKTNYKIW